MSADAARQRNLPMNIDPCLPRGSPSGRDPPGRKPTTSKTPQVRHSITSGQTWHPPSRSSSSDTHPASARWISWSGVPIRVRAGAARWSPPVCGTNQVRTLAGLPTQPSAQPCGGCAGPFTPAGASQSWNDVPPPARSVGAACTSISDPVTPTMKILWWGNHEASDEDLPL